VTLSGSNTLSRWPTDRLLLWLLRGAAAIAGAIVLLIVAFLVMEALPVLRHVGVARFFTDPSWHPAEGFYNLTPMLWGTLFAMVGSVLIATPLGILSAVFCHYYAPPAVARHYRKLIELLAGIPSVVYGFWGLVVLVPLIGAIHPPGPSLLAGIVILAIMILPTIALMTDASLTNVPQQYVRGAAALGLSRWATIRGVVFPAAKSALFTGVILETGRAIGETMAIQRWPRLFGQHVPVLKWGLAVFCLRGGAPCGQVVNVHSIRRVTVTCPMRPGLVVERQVAR